MTRAQAQPRPRRPNVLLVMADQLSALLLPPWGGSAKTPHLWALAGRGVVFDNAYCNSPICAPSRFSMMSGRLPCAIGAFDNASEFAASVPTIAHLFCAAGYRTILAGKMHFIGPDQQHGFEERLTTDIYPADFSWTPDWRRGPADKPSGISMRNVTQAGVCVRSLQMDYDDEVEYASVQRLYDLAREPQRPPFFMTVSFSHPHPPYTIDAEHWDRYQPEEIGMPRVPPIPPGQRDAHSHWLHVSHGGDEQPVSREQVLRARHAYHGMVSWLDDKLGRLLHTLEECGMRQDTVVAFTADHGEMLGERGLWYKQNFFEPSARVPLVIDAQVGHRRIVPPVSLVDLLPTLGALCGIEQTWPDPLDGISLAHAIVRGEPPPSRAILCEYTDMGVIAPCRMIRRGPWKLMYTHGHPSRLYHLERDPLELDDLAGDPAHAATRDRLQHELLATWDPDAVDQAVRASQRRRLFLKQTSERSGRLPDWSFQAFRDDSKRYVRASGAAGAKARARFPYVAEEDVPTS